ncbi:MAG: sugar phosphate nucleotidyltransferase, partial [Burkholderiaceae bacterium]
LLAVQDVPRADTRHYGVVRSVPVGPRLERVEGIVEKPLPEEAPSTLAVVGRYVLDHRIFPILERVEKGLAGEIQLTDGIATLMKTDPVFAYRYIGRRYDCGSKLGYLKAMTAMGLKHAEVGTAFRDFLDELR